MTFTGKKTWLGFVLALTIALNTLLPFFATYTDKAPPSGLASLFGEKVLICTSEGFVWVKFEDLVAGKTPVKPHKGYFCPLCYIANDVIGKALLAAAGIYLAGKKLVGTTLFLRRGVALISAPLAVSHPRAPPLSFA